MGSGERGVPRLFSQRVRKLLEINEMTCRGRHPSQKSLGIKKSEARVRKCKKVGELRFAGSARFAQREQLDWELRVERREIWRA